MGFPEVSQRFVTLLANLRFTKCHILFASESKSAVQRQISLAETAVQQFHKD